MSKVYVLFWFDVEDYITPQSDDAVKRLAEIFDACGLRATFKLVGEKLRMLERRKRWDVIEVLRGQDIGYHTEFHSVHPTVAEYLREMEWDEGVEAFLLREGPGVEDLKRVFGRTPSCYGQPGGSWAAQACPALLRMGIPAYVDEGRYVGLEEQPFWYCGVLHLFNMGRYGTRVSLRDGEEGLLRAEDQFRAIRSALRAQGGTVSIYYHPCEFVTEEFWDGVNYARGQNTPETAWRLPRLKSSVDAEEAYGLFEAYLNFIRSQPEIEVITAREFMELYADRSVGRTFPPAEIAEWVRAIRREITYQIVDGASLSPAEIFGLVVEALRGYAEHGALPASVPHRVLLGPVRQPPTFPGEREIARKDFERACIEGAAYLRKQGRLPDAVDLGGMRVGPADFLATAGEAFTTIFGNEAFPDRFALKRGSLTTDQYVQDYPGWNWVVFPEGFRAPKIVELAKLQGWTLKPALLAS